MSDFERLYRPPQIGAPGRAAARARSRSLRRSGLFVVLMALLLIAVLLLLRFRNLDAIELRTYLPFTDGLTAGALVEQAGYTIGTVVAVTPSFPAAEQTPGCSATANTAAEPATAPPPQHRPCFLVRLRIDRQWPIPADSVAVLGSKLLQGAVIRIQPGNASALLADNDTLNGRGDDSDLASSVNQLVVRLGTLLDHVQGIMDQTVAPLLSSINQQVGALQQLTVSVDGEGGSNTGAALKDVAEVLNNLKQLTGDLASPASQDRDTDIGKLLRATRLAAENVEGITAAVDSRTEEIRKAVSQFTALGERLNKLARNASPGIERAITDSQYLMQETATALTPILNNIDETTRNLLELSRDLRDNPAVLIGGRDNGDNSPNARSGGRQ
jgi:phospholipid/cholesterol/gamma-HCH transport system substrate-binding protein